MADAAPKTKSWFVRHKVLTVLLVFLGLGLINSIVSSGKSTAPTPASQPAVQHQAAAPSPVPAPAPQPVKEPTKLDRLWLALDAAARTRAGYDIQFDEKTGIATVTQTPASVWDESAIVRRAYANLVYFGIEAFKIEGVTAVKSVVRGAFTDSYGKQATEDAARLTMTKEEFAKYDWTKLEYQPVWQQMKRSSTDYYMHPAIVKGLKFDDLYLTKP